MHPFQLWVQYQVIWNEDVAVQFTTIISLSIDLLSIDLISLLHLLIHCLVYHWVFSISYKEWEGQEPLRKSESTQIREQKTYCFVERQWKIILLEAKRN